MKFVRGMQYGLLLSLIAFFAGCATQDAGNISPLANQGEVRAVAKGFISTEGPVWHAGSGRLFFSDIPGDTIYAYHPQSDALTVLRSPSNTANGLALTADQHLLAAEQKTRLISRMNVTTGEINTFADSALVAGETRKFNSPNDMAVHSSGLVYFTDPPFGLRGRENERELNFNGVFIRYPTGEIELFKSLPVGTNPNGIILSPDEETLYLAISSDQSAPIFAYDVSADGQLSNERAFAEGQNNDGMAVDAQGNLYVATRTGVKVWSQTGRYWGQISLPGNLRTTNCAFGGATLDTLYITNRSSDLYAVKLDVTGHLPHSN